MKLKLYQYEWYDHYHTSGWQVSIPNNEDFLVLGVGYLIGEDTRHLHFTEGYVPSQQQYKGTMSVLKSALKKKTLIKTITI